jgi:hypothetical protein
LRRPILIISLSGCVAKRYNVENLSSFGSGVSIQYKDPQTLYEEEIKKAQVMLRPPPVAPGSYSYLQINITASTIGAANTKYWGAKITSMDGSIVYAEESGRNDIPNYSTGKGTTWWNIMIIMLKTPMPDEFKVHVFDRLMTRRYDFIVRKNQEFKG